MKLLALIIFILFDFVSGAGALPSAPKVNNCGVFLGASAESTSNLHAEQMATAYIKILEWLLERKLITLEEVQETVNSNSPTVPQSYIGLSENYHAANQGLKTLTAQMTSSEPSSVWKLTQTKAHGLIETLKAQTGEKQVAKTKTQKIFMPHLAKSIDLKSLIPSKTEIDQLKTYPTKSGKLIWLTRDTETSKLWVGVDEKAIGLSNMTSDSSDLVASIYESNEGRIYIAAPSIGKFNFDSPEKFKIMTFEIIHNQLKPIKEFDIAHSRVHQIELWQDSNEKLHVTTRLTQEQDYTDAQGKIRTRKHSILESYDLTGSTGRIEVFHPFWPLDFKIIPAGKESPYFALTLYEGCELPGFPIVRGKSIYVLNSETLKAIPSLHFADANSSDKKGPVVETFQDGHSLLLFGESKPASLNYFDTRGKLEFIKIENAVSPTRGIKHFISNLASDSFDMVFQFSDELQQTRFFFNGTRGATHELNLDVELWGDASKHFRILHPKLKNLLVAEDVEDLHFAQVEGDIRSELNFDQNGLSLSDQLIPIPLILPTGETFVILQNPRESKIHLIGLEQELNE